MMLAGNIGSALGRLGFNYNTLMYDILTLQVTQQQYMFWMKERLIAGTIVLLASQLRCQSA